MNVTVYCGSSMGGDPRFADAARQLGKWIGQNGHSLVYGGSSIGLMGIVARTVLEAGGQVQGVETGFFVDAGVAQDGITRLHVVDDMGQRKAKMIELGDAFVALPGGVGTLEEISEIMSRIRLGLGAQPCCFLNIAGFYDAFKAFVDRMLAEGFVARKDVDRFLFAGTVDEATALIEEAWRVSAPACATAPEMTGR